MTAESVNESDISTEDIRLAGAAAKYLRKHNIAAKAHRADATQTDPFESFCAG